MSDLLLNVACVLAVLAACVIPDAPRAPNHHHQETTQNERTR